MRNKIKGLSAIVIFSAIMVGCFREKNKKANSEGRVIIIAKLNEPIHAAPAGASFFNHFLSITSSIGDKHTNGNNSNQIGVYGSQVEGVGKSNDVITYNVVYSDYSVDAANVTTSDCDTLTLEIYFENNLVHSDVKEVGYADCLNGFGGVDETFVLP